MSNHKTGNITQVATDVASLRTIFDRPAKNDTKSRDQTGPNSKDGCTKAISKFSGDQDQKIRDAPVRRQQVTTKLVNNLHAVDQQSPINSDSYDNTEKDRSTNLDKVPSKFTPDADNASPVNGGYDDEYEYYDDNEDYDDESCCERNDELADLSRQSMMPLRELIAYYQYIQQSDDGTKKISRQASSASSQTIKPKTQSSLDSESSVNHNSVISSEGENLDDSSQKERSREVYITRINVEGKISTFETPKNNVGGSKMSEDLDLTQHSMRDKRRVRANVVLELINSERDFVKHLQDVVEGYLYPARRHPEIFTGERINTIFSNIEQLYEFQRQFLDSLETCINWDDLAASEVGEVFLRFGKGFSVYHHYCNNHPNASSELQELYTKTRFVKFFEACRLIQNMIDISLDGFLLTPIQKICKYPLQLNELLKNTVKDHPDYLPVMNALESMRNCANLANERKRRIEALADVMSFHEKVENWFGPKLCDTSSILIHSGEVSKMTSHTWSQGVQLYLFDHLLLYAKKDLLKRNILILKGRICMDTVTDIADADEYKPKRSFKLYCSEQRKWFVFTTRSEKEKDEWIRAFERERSLIEADENEGFQITNKEIGIARRTLQNRKHSRSARYPRHKRPDTAIVDLLDLDDANAIMNRTLSLPSCIHPSHVMNFVEDSRVVSSGRKKSTSPSQSSRSPVPSSHLISELDSSPQQGSTGASWFRKMGSKKLARSQVYNINGSSRPSTLMDSPTGTFVDITNSTAAEKYDQLEKRHRDHMSSEEQARLFRLNNDLPLNFHPSNQHQSGGQQSTSRFRTQAASDGASKVSDLRSDLRSLSLTPSGCTRQSGNDLNSSDRRASSPYSNNGQVAKRQSETSYEATVVLSSGKVVRVREDEV